MTDEIAKKLTHCGETYIIAGTEMRDQEEWTLVDMPKTTDNINWTHIWHHVADIVGHKNMKGTVPKSTGLWVKTERMTAFNMAIYQYRRWLLDNNSSCRKESFNPLVDKNQRELPLKDSEVPGQKQKGHFPEVG
jgi:hypothetical protein